VSARLAILYVDDDDDIRTICELALGLDPDIELRSAMSGPAALAMLAEGGWRPQAVLLDVMMPGMDGPAVMDALRAIDGLAEVPVIFMTARTRDADVAGYRARGAIDVIAKPFDPLSLAARVRAIVGRARP
jgi:DNA-binding response OmpR family regulator